MKMPAVREEEFTIEIDQKKNHYPFVRFQWGSKEDGTPVLLVVANCNQRGDVIGENEGVAILALSVKKVRRLNKFLTRTLKAIPE
jgi:hypothetical protein